MTQIKEPAIKWPDGAKCSVMLSFDVDGETIWKGKPDGKPWTWPRNRTQGSYGPQRALPRILDLLDHYQVKATFHKDVCEGG
jgi:peptidoglycan/xylan/chitin deacetylase (PgdA/CDA1 family)